jgi:hypothetical protein
LLIKFAARSPLVLTVASLFLSLSAAQQTVPPSNPDSSGQNEAPKVKSKDEKEIEKKEQSQRALSVLPMFGVTNRLNASPLTPREKFHLFFKSAFDPATVATVGLQAGLSQAVNEFPGYGQGMEGYGKRFGASLADEVSNNFWNSFVYPTLLKQDPRYFRLGRGSFGHRFSYSVKQEFVCHSDKGGRSFNFSSVLGAFTSGAISNLYYPGKTLIRTIPATATAPAIPVYENDRGFALTMSRTAIGLGYGVAGGLFDEFWPDLRNKFRKHKEEALPHATSNP